ncbi:NAD-dependent epimerase/dehydratase family protein [Shimia sp. R9_2]|uniref:NAD-dependent epimerase/dehydratase family protein n=1 Tax=Shimia sp. R9_2 TaxID=2821112 RepID=UPI001ADD484F|nr:NAD-dependent epimerase/dehydratase family protein [Shimia sp. R9_2]MBO9398611.1 NAD-dependent epimerase/dehydratase family protein [Shimia sp. R9_2]
MSSEPIYLVTGAAGFVGEHLVRHLKGAGVKVRAMVRKPAQAEALKSLVDEVVVADLAQPESLPAAVEGVAGIYHLASIFRQEGLPDETFYDINAEGTRRIFEAAIAAGVPRIIHCSTNGVHSDIDHPPATEDYPFKPGDIYQETKLAGEEIASEYFADGRMAGVVLRPTMIWGPGDDRTLKMFRMIQKGRFFFVGDGGTLHHWVDVRDLAAAFRQAMESEVNNEAFLIGGREYVSLRNIANEIADQLGKPKPSLRVPVGPMMLLAHATEIVCKPLGIEPPIFRRRVGFFIKNRAYDISKAHRILNFQPKQDIAGEIADIIEAYKSDGKLA